MTDWQGNPLGFGSDGRVVAGSPAVHAHLLRVIAQVGG
jgi:fructose-1,6-bisphosphatase/inositol monophosphatase family enzyme